VAGHPGHPAADPQVLLAVWLFALSNGVILARGVDRLCTEHLASIWLCGGMAVNYHTLSDVRAHNQEAIDALFVQIIGRLVHAGLVDLATVAQGGLRLRAAAGTSSFHRAATLERALGGARDHLARLRATADGQQGGVAGSGPPTPRQHAARLRAAREQVSRLEQARRVMADLQAKADPADREKLRVSTTDPEARVMRFPDGGFRPAFNAQLAAEPAHRIIVGVEASPNGSDMRRAPPMVEQVTSTGARVATAPPATWLVDGGFVSPRIVRELERRRVRLIGPQPTKPSDVMMPNDPTAAVWRAQMATPEAKALYRQRGRAIELCNARARKDFGLLQLPVRSLAEVKPFLALFALAHHVLYGLVKLLHRQQVVPATT
jgi:transposase